MSITYVCPDKDIVCGNHPKTWCDSCPKRKQLLAHSAGSAKAPGKMATVNPCAVCGWSAHQAIHNSPGLSYGHDYSSKTKDQA